MVHHRVLPRPQRYLKINGVVTTLKEHPQGAELLVARDLNINLEALEGD